MVFEMKSNQERIYISVLLYTYFSFQVLIVQRMNRSGSVNTKQTKMYNDKRSEGLGDEVSGVGAQKREKRKFSKGMCCRRYKTFTVCIHQS